MRFIKKGWEFQSIYKEHQRLNCSYFTLLLQQKNDIDGPAFGIVIRKKIGNAVVRNKLKRRLRAFFREMGRKLPANLRTVVIARNEASSISWDMMVRDLTNCLKKAHLLTRDEDDK
jgi:ribonuclease P protein component